MLGLSLLSVVCGAGAAAVAYSTGHVHWPAAPVPQREFSLTHPTPTGPRPGVLGPQRVSIPALGIDARWIYTGIDAGGMKIPEPDPTVIGRLPPGQAPARMIFMAGHVTWNAARGALYPLSGAQPGDVVAVTSPAGRTSQWVVQRMQLVRRAPIVPAGYLLPHAERTLVLVTCGGDVVDTPHGRVYADNVVVTAAPLRPEAPPPATARPTAR